MADYSNQYLDKTQQARPKVQRMFGTSSFISTAGLRSVLKEYGDDFDNLVPKAIGCVFGGLAASGAAAGTFGLGAIAGGTAGYTVGQAIGAAFTGRVKGFIENTLKEAEAAENGTLESN